MNTPFVTIFDQFDLLKAKRTQSTARHAERLISNESSVGGFKV